jgi:hypothetical protein
MARIELPKLEATASGGPITATPATAVWALSERSRLCNEEIVATLSIGVDLQKTLGCSQGTMSGPEVMSEQPATVEAIDALGAAKLKQKDPSK